MAPQAGRCPRQSATGSRRGGGRGALGVREAIGHLTKGLALLETLEETRERDDWELQFLTALAPAYIAPAVTPRPSRADPAAGARTVPANREQQHSGSCWACGSGALCAAICGSCVDLAADGMALAESLNDPGMHDGSMFMPGVTMFYRAQFADARACFENALGAYDDRERHEVLDRLFRA